MVVPACALCGGRIDRGRLDQDKLVSDEVFRGEPCTAVLAHPDLSEDAMDLLDQLCLHGPERVFDDEIAEFGGTASLMAQLVGSTHLVRIGADDGSSVADAPPDGTGRQAARSTGCGGDGDARRGIHSRRGDRADSCVLVRSRGPTILRRPQAIGRGR